MRSPRVTRVVRGSMAGAFATFMALMSHVAAGGALPGWVGIVVPLVLSMLLCMLLAGRKLSATRTLVGVSVSQFFFHTLFILGAASSGATAGTAGTMGHHNHGAMVMTEWETTATLITADTTMWGWHALAATVTAVVVYRAERAAFLMRALAAAIAGWFRRVIVALIGILVEPARATRSAVDTTVLPALSRLFVARAWRRGPPVARLL